MEWKSGVEMRGLGWAERKCREHISRTLDLVGISPSTWILGLLGTAGSGGGGGAAGDCPTCSPTHTHIHISSIYHPLE